MMSEVKNNLPFDPEAPSCQPRRSSQRPPTGAQTQTFKSGLNISIY